MNATCGQRPIRSAQEEDHEIALSQWQANIRRLRVLVTQADEFTPPSFVKRVDEFMPELRSAAMGTVITTNTIYNATSGQALSQHISVRDSQGKITTRNTFGGKLLP